MVAVATGTTVAESYRQYPSALPAIHGGVSGQPENKEEREKKKSNENLNQLTTFITAGTSAAGAGAARGSSGSSGSLGLDVALGGASGSLVDGLNGGNGLVLTVVVVACRCDMVLVERDMEVEDRE